MNAHNLVTSTRGGKRRPRPIQGCWAKHYYLLLLFSSPLCSTAAQFSPWWPVLSSFIRSYLALHSSSPWSSGFVYLVLCVLHISFLQLFMSSGLERCPSFCHFFYIYVSLCNWYNFLLYLTCHVPLSLLGSHIFLKVFILDILTLFSSSFINAQISLPYNRTGHIKVSCISF
jgi:hypothetical protein